MSKPFDIGTATDSASPSTRQLRDAFWDKNIGSKASLVQFPASAMIFPGAGAVADFAKNLPEFPTSPSTLWVIGKFESYETFLSESQRSIYTEINFAVDQAFGPDATTLPHLITLGQRGGTVKTVDGTVVSYAIMPRQDELRPGGMYLLRLLRYPLEQFFTVQEQWDLSTGKAQALTSAGRYRVSSKSSRVSGKSIPEIKEQLLSAYPVAGGPPVWVPHP